MAKKKKKNKGFSVFRLLITILCLFSVAVCVSVNVIFTRDKVPAISDRYIYLVEEPNPLAGDISSNSALIARSAKNISIAEGDIVICYPADAPDTMTLRSINSIVDTEDGTQRYYTRDAVHEDNSASISKDDIVAVCTGYPESVELGMFINFTLSMTGIIAELIFPCVLLILMLIIKIVASKADDDDEEEEVNVRKTQKKGAHERGQDAPLYRPDVQPSESEELKIKKESIEKNFSAKQVDPNSKYQKEKERTMQFRIQAAKLEAQKRQGIISHDADPKDAPEIEKQTARPANLEQFEAPKPTNKVEAPAETPVAPTVAESVPEPTPVTVAEPVAPAKHEKVSDDTGVISRTEVEKIADGEEQKAVNERAEVPAPVKEEGPAVEEVKGTAEKPAAIKKKKVAAMSVDDLIRLIDEEKKKL